MQSRKYPVGKPVASGPGLPHRVWTEITCDHTELLGLLGMPAGTTIISMRHSATEVVITAEEP